MPRSPYTGWVSARLLAFARPACAAALLVVAAPVLGGCSYQLGSMFADSKAEPETTASIRPTAVGAYASLSAVPSPSEADLAYARAAATEALARGGKDTSHPWENPHTGARGSVTPLTNAYSANGVTCRDFLASYVKDKAETWLQGEACKVGKGWEVRTMKPWRRV
ncbi:RT0821/Lpp0805 family surface protein [Bradyrhizobium sp. LHD-71]|uniref:RT0821/Lpp0805 family surface protein n=1 Tax=Bradyrhizobium sp. LHD-71 TaxID=3072141 RepID=UPI00280FDFD1|nr:RT0821/Lpp0805 family surface protein [Bradyrhizobium sp. LHD-71]MDQ8732003.1 RT0821/Lpp0805 family surface protein [Bradyrhizobium sp. LHD-71]